MLHHHMTTRIDLHHRSEETDPTFAGQRDVLFAVSELLGRKWHALILYNLDQESMGFAELKSEIGGISGKMLAESLDRLTDEYGVVDRTEIDDGLNRVEYSLSKRGETLAPLLLALQDWGSENLDTDRHT